MGLIQHRALVVTGFNEHVDKARDEALKILGGTSVLGAELSQLVSPIIDGTTNGYRTFVIAPDGSKEGWSTSDDCEARIETFMAWLQDSGLYLDWALVTYGELGVTARDGLVEVRAWETADGWSADARPARSSGGRAPEGGCVS